VCWLRRLYIDPPLSKPVANANVKATTSTRTMKAMPKIRSRAERLIPMSPS
jgi:hypothetical protein